MWGQTAREAFQLAMSATCRERVINATGREPAMNATGRERAMNATGRFTSQLEEFLTKALCAQPAPPPTPTPTPSSARCPRKASTSNLS